MSRPRTSDLESMEIILQNLVRSVPGYPLDLALLARLSQLLEKRMADAVNAALRPLELTYVLYQTMVFIHASGDGTATPSVIAELTGERPNNVTHICHQLEDRGFITRQPASGDRRRIEVSLTAAGRRLLARAQPRVWAVWERRFAGIDPRQATLLQAVLRRQVHNLDEPREQAGAVHA